MIRCIGCNNPIPWDGKSTFSYTCSCGATIFINEDTGGLTMPGSVALGMVKGKNLPHLDDLVGNSDFTSPRKEQLITELRGRCFIWMNECEQCKKDGTLKRYESRLRHEKRIAEVRKQAEEEGWDIEKTIQELVKVDKES